MTPAESEQALIHSLLGLPDPQERLSWITKRKGSLPPFDDQARDEAHRVLGCVSNVWLDPRLEEGICRFPVATDSVMVAGLARLLCEIYDGHFPASVISHEPRIFQELGLDKILSGTRLTGLAAIRARIRQFAETAA